MTAFTPLRELPSATNFKEGDVFLCRPRGKSLNSGSSNNNIVAIARDILETQGGLVLADFNDANWDSFRDKVGVQGENIDFYFTRAWIQEPVSIIEFCLSLLEQVRLDIFVTRDLPLELNSLHFGDFVAPASIAFEIKNWDIVAGSFNLQADFRNNINRAKARFNFLPDLNNNLFESSIFKNTAAITASGKEIAKQLTFPNMTGVTDVTDQVISILRLSSAYIEIIQVQLTWRALLLDLGDFVKLNIDIGGTVLEDVPCMVRSIGYDPSGLKIPVTLWSFQMLPYTGYAPGYSGITGGESATIDEE